MKKLKVLIFDVHCPDRIEQELKQIIGLLNLECEIFSTENYKVAREKVGHEKFDIVSLCDLLCVVDENEARRFVATALALSPNAVIFFLLGEPIADTFKFARENEVNLVFSMGRNFGMTEIIFHPDDISDLKKAMAKAGMIKCQVSHKLLTDPICIFSQTYADSTPSERMAKEACDAVAAKLNAKEVKYSAIDNDFHFDISVSAEKKAEAVRIALSSGLKFWYDYAIKHLI